MRVSKQLQLGLMVSSIIMTLSVMPSATALGQWEQPAAEAAQTAEHPSQWLNRAREAMGVQNFLLAQQSIEMAESLVTPETQLAYTPAMARQELQQQVAALQQQASGQPMQAAGQSMQTSQPQNWNEAPVTADIEQARQLLLQARQALAVGNVAGEDGAAAKLHAASIMNVDFSMVGDSPKIIESMIDQQNQLAAMYQQQHPSYNTGAVAFLMKQAETLVKYQDFASAADLIEQAKTFNVPFNDTTGNPDHLMAIIDAAQRSQSTAAVTPAAAEMSYAAAPSTPATQVVQTPPAAPVQEAPPANLSTPKQEVMKLMSQAQFAIDRQQWEQAQRLVQAAANFKLDDDQFTTDEIRPWQMELKIQTALNLQEYQQKANEPNFVVNQPASTNVEEGANVVQAKYDPAMDTSQNVQVAANFADSTAIGTGTQTGQQPSNPFQTSDTADTLPVRQTGTPLPTRGMQLYKSGLQALQSGEQDRAQEYFQLALQYQDEIDEPTAKTIKGLLNAAIPAAPSAAPQASPSDKLNVPDISEEQQVAFRKLQSEVFRERQAAEKLLEKSPREALEKMSLLRSRIASSPIAPETRRPLLIIIDRDISEMQVYIEKNLSQIKSKEELESRKELVSRNAQRRLDVEQQLQQLVEEYNDLMDEERFAEASQIVAQARDLSPDSEIVAILQEKHKFKYREIANRDAKAAKEAGFWGSMHEAEIASVPHEGAPLKFDPDRDSYTERMTRRASRLTEGQYATEADRNIWNKLKNVEVEGEYQGTLAEAIDQLSRQAGINIVFDTMALEAEGVQTDQMVNVPIRNPISLQSALNVILGTTGLVFAVENEVIKVTSMDAKRTKLVPKTYYIGDLVVPMNNFQNPLNMTFSAAGQNNNGYGAAGMLNTNSPQPLTVGQNQGPMSQVAMAQQLGGGGLGSNPFGGFGGPGGYGSGGFGPQTGAPIFGSMGGQPKGGVTEADFQQLIGLIQGVVDTDSWQDTGQGEGTIRPFVPNLSLIVSQTQEVQDEIQDLLKKLRELNDVQIVIEVRFVSIQDNFFERVGIDFDFAINDNSGVTDPTIDVLPGGSTVIGNAGDGVSNGSPFIPTVNQDIQFTQGSFGITTPNFGGFDLTSAANFGFAILSDIEVFFLIQASKGNSRANIMQAPTVTMFNGQSANVTDGSSRPFVTSVTPVVGDFAVAHAPVITILPDGTSLNVSAVVSNDRRSVRLSLVPFFSQVTEVRNFTFSGSQTTERSTNSFLDDLLDLADPATADAGDDELQTTTQGVTIQLPVIATTSVSTVVSVPDGGTVLLGGIKRMTEERVERGVPFLSSVPYVNRLFKNVGVGRETENLMMMVTPRIIIQEEEEEKQIGSFGSTN